MARRIDTDIYDTVIADKLLYNMTTREIAEKTGIGVATVNRIMNSYNLVKAEDWEGLCDRVIREEYTLAHAEWAADRMGKIIPMDVYKTYERVKTEAKQKAEAEAKEQEEQEKPQAPAEVPEIKMVAKTADDKNTAFYLLKMMEAINKQNELLEQLCDVVIPHWVTDMKDNNNANADATGERLDRVEQLLEGIKCNTRKRGL